MRQDAAVLHVCCGGTEQGWRPKLQHTALQRGRAGGLGPGDVGQSGRLGSWGAAHMGRGCGCGRQHLAVGKEGMRLEKAAALEISDGQCLKKSPLPPTTSIPWLPFLIELFKIFSFFCLI